MTAMRRIGGLLALWALFACSSPISLENYNKLKAGQSFDDVKTILGEPTRCDEMLGIRSCVWGGDERQISVNFLAGQVVLLSATNLK